MYKVKGEIGWLMIFADTQRLVVFFYLQDTPGGRRQDCGDVILPLVH